jgi:hypothetical protein
MTLIASALAVLATALSTPEAKRKDPPHRVPFNVALASWYDDAGATASGAHYTYGFASLAFGSAWGHRIRFCYGRRCVTGRLDDHGPYVGGRLFDLNGALKAALGCPDLCWLRWQEWVRPRPLGARLVLR